MADGGEDLPHVDGHGGKVEPRKGAQCNGYFMAMQDFNQYVRKPTSCYFLCSFSMDKSSEDSIRLNVHFWLDVIHFWIVLKYGQLFTLLQYIKMAQNYSSCLHNIAHNF